MSVVGETFVTVHSVSAALEKEIAAQAKVAATAAEKSLKLTPSVNTSGAKSELGRLEQAAQNAGKQLGGVSGAAGSAGKGTNILATVMADARAKLHTVAEEGGYVSSKLAGVAESATFATPAVGGLLLAVAALAAVTIGGVAKFVSLASEIRKFEILSGSSAETASRFVVALHELGVAPNTVAAGLFRLAQQIGNNTDKLAESNVAVARTAEGNVDLVKTFLNIADAVHKAADGTARNTIAFNAFGRQGRELVPILSRGKEALGEFLRLADEKHLVFDDEQLDKARDFQVAMRSLGSSIEGLEVGIASGAVPAITTFINALTTVIDHANDAAHAVGGLGNVLRVGLGIATGGVSEGVIRLAQHLGAQGNAAAAAKAQTESYLQTMRVAQGEVDSLRGALTGLVSAQAGVASADHGIATAEQAATEARYQLSQVQKRGGVDVAALASAQRGLESSTKSLNKAEDNLAKAQQNLIDVQAGASPRDLEEANLHVSESTNAVARAQAALTVLQKHHRVSSLDLSDAQNQVESASLAQADALDALDTLQKKGTEGSKEYVDAQQQVSDAEDAVADAKSSRETAEQSLRDAQKGDVTYAHDYASAQQAVHEADYNVKTAKDARTTAVLNLDSAQRTETQSLLENADAVGQLRGELEALSQMQHVDLSDLLGLLPVTEALGAAAAKKGSVSSTLAPAIQVSLDIANQPSKGTTTITHGSAKKGLAEGGRNRAGDWYQVNERGQEFWKSDQNGTIIPVGGGGPATSSPTINNHIYGVADPITTSRFVNIETGRALRTAGR